MGLRQKGFVFIFFLFLTFFSLLLVKVPTTIGNMQDLEAIHSQIQDTKAELSQKKKKEKSVLNSLTKAQRELQRIENDLEYINARIKTSERHITEMEAELRQIEHEREALEDRILHRQEKLDQRLIAAYKYGLGSYFEPLVSANSFGDFISKFEALSYFLRNDLSLLGEVEKSKKQLITKEEEYILKRENLQARRDKYAGLKKQADRNQKQKVVLISRAKKELNTVQNDRKKLETALDELEQTSKKLEEEIRKKQRSGEVLGTGKMVWPVKAQISSNFGWRMHPILKEKRFHSGIDLAVVTGTAVAAADSGRVLVSSWNGGYGYFIAIDHGNGISTAYGHNSRLLVKEGEIVIKGQTISLSGSTGLSTGPHLHFEVRKDGKPVNPIPFLP